MLGGRRAGARPRTACGSWPPGLEKSDGAAVPGQESGFSAAPVTVPAALPLGSVRSKLRRSPEMLAALQLLGKVSIAIPDPKMFWMAEVCWLVRTENLSQDLCIGIASWVFFSSS